MDATGLIDLQNRIVTTIARSIPEAWDTAVISIEIDLVDGEQTENYLGLFYKKSGDSFSQASWPLPSECVDQFVCLRDNSSSPPWTGCLLEFDSSGGYRFSYSYDPPKRINGIYDDEAMLKDYTPHFAEVENKGILNRLVSFFRKFTRREMPNR